MANLSNFSATDNPQLALPLGQPATRSISRRRKRNVALSEATAEARELAFSKLEGKRSKRHCLILEALTKRPMTAREVLRQLIEHGHLPATAERNQTSPRISELAAAGCVEALEELRTVGSDAPATAWAITSRGLVLLDGLHRERATEQER